MSSLSISSSEGGPHEAQLLGSHRAPPTTRGRRPRAVAGGYRVGHRVISRSAAFVAKGTVKVGDEGTVTGPWQFQRVNCKFPQHASINMHASQLRRPR